MADWHKSQKREKISRKLLSQANNVFMCGSHIIAKWIYAEGGFNANTNI